MSIYKNAFLRALLLDDGNVAGSGGALGDWTQSHFSGDFYAPGDARRPFGMGAMQRRAGTSKKKKKKKKKKGKKKKSTIKEYRNIEPTGDGGQPQISPETQELLTIVKETRTSAEFGLAEYKVAEIWNGWGDELQKKIKREIHAINGPHMGTSEEDILLLLIRLAEKKSEDDEGDIDPNGGWGGLSI